MIFSDIGSAQSIHIYSCCQGNKGPTSKTEKITKWNILTTIFPYSTTYISSRKHDASVVHYLHVLCQLHGVFIIRNKLLPSLFVLILGIKSVRQPYFSWIIADKGGGSLLQNLQLARNIKAILTSRAFLRHKLPLSLGEKTVSHATR